MKCGGSDSTTPVLGEKLFLKIEVIFHFLRVPYSNYINGSIMEKPVPSTHSCHPKYLTDFVEI
jgi:hypothetical protein